LSRAPVRLSTLMMKQPPLGNVCRHERRGEAKSEHEPSWEESRADQYARTSHIGLSWFLKK
jgi:hypothetical protein